MSNFLLDSVSEILSTPAVSAVATQLGLSESQIAQGLETTVATLGAGIAAKSSDTGFVRKIYDLATSQNISAGLSAASPALPMTPNTNNTASTDFLSSLFGGSTNGITGAIASVTGMSASSVSSVLSMAVPLVLGAIGTQIKAHGLDVSSFGAWLTKQKDSLMKDAPAGISTLLGASIPAIPSIPDFKAKAAPTYDAAVASMPARSSLRLLWPAIAAILVIGVLWTYLHRTHGTPIAAAPVADTTTTTATSAGAVDATTANMVSKHLPNGTDLNVPNNGTETKLLAYLADSSHKSDDNTWFDFDRLLFKTGSSTLEPSSTDQLKDVATILAAYPSAKVTIGGYTDNTGNADANVKLSQDRATSVMQQLVSQGVDSTRMTAKGYGDQHPVGDNGTDAGRAQNRRISLKVVSQ